MNIYKPTREEVQAAGRRVPDVIARDLRVLFCGINPGLYTAAVGHHFARPKARTGRQEEKLEAATVWVLPNPSGLNANYRIEDLARLFRELRAAVEREL